jgi:hypothetical protein
VRHNGWTVSATVRVTSHETIRGETRTIVIRPDGTQIITVVGNDGRLPPHPPRRPRPRDHHHRQQL